MKYFGYLDFTTYQQSNLTPDDFFLDSKLFTISEPRTIISGLRDRRPPLRNFTPIPELRDEYYDYIIDLYSGGIALERFTFFKEFNDEIYGWISRFDLCH
ncbi:hypothetical protein SAMN05443667_1131 [Flavobacterium gillisiae]|uniref:Uncharacterized protein n=1 Tax=Flavobacterium gillisiae TaxID=150146 RepID=A0A1H4FEG7_9FLAO|nr:hypothetical protein SAMN05443667_1131 [Flavobacterium gillisiae]